MAMVNTINVKQLQEGLINRILIVSAIVVDAAYIGVLFRTSTFGFSYRDAIQLISVIAITSLAVFHKRIMTHTKAIALILSYTLGGIAGVYSLGIMAGTVFIFPAAAIIIAIFCPLRALWIYIILFFLFFSLIAFLFCSGKTVLPNSASYLLTSYFHWLVYALSMSIFFTVACTTVYNYRKSMELMLHEIMLQKNDLQIALDEVKTLSGLLPICMHCKKIRDDQGYWKQLEEYISEHSEAQFSHGICQDCFKKIRQDFLAEQQSKNQSS